MLTRLERWLFARLGGGASRPGTNYGYRPGVVFRTARYASIVRSLLLTRRLGGLVIVDRAARIRIARDAVVTLTPGSILVIGIEPPGRPTTLDVHPRAEVTFAGSVTLMAGSSVQVNHDSRLRIGHRTYLNSGSRVLCGHHVEIGSDCAISWNVTIADSDVHRLRRGARAETGDTAVVVDDHTWIGAQSTILKGVRIGHGAVVGAGSVVTRDVAERSLVAGNPARVVDADVEWDL